MPPRAIWSGSLSFGLVNVPVGLYTATTDNVVHFNQIHRGTSHRIRYKKIDEVTGEEVESADIVSGFAVGGDEYVIVSPDELKQAAPGRSETIEISDFVELDRIDPIYFRQSYYLAPKNRGAGRAYALLLEAMRETNRVGIATFVLRDKEHLVAVRPSEHALVVETMFFADEIRNPSEIVGSDLDDAAVQPRELEIAKQLINALAAEWKPERYENTYRARIEELIEEKRQGHEVVFDDDRPRSNVIDLMSALEASVARSQQTASAVEAQVDASVSNESVSSSAPASRSSRRRARAEEAGQQAFEGMSKAELLARAAELDVQGRSKMSKLELVSALTEAQRPEGRRTRKVS